MEEIRELANVFAEEIKRKISKFPKHAKQWLKTYKYVINCCKNNNS